MAETMIVYDGEIAMPAHHERLPDFATMHDDIERATRAMHGGLLVFMTRGLGGVVRIYASQEFSTK